MLVIKKKKKKRNIQKASALKKTTGAAQGGKGGGAWESEIPEHLIDHWTDFGFYSNSEVRAVEGSGHRSGRILTFQCKS